MYQGISTLCGFIIPNLILRYYGSNVNGLVSSIVQFLSIISLMELGMGAVVPSSLYKPLVDKNQTEISCIYVSATKFYKKLALVFLGYVLVLAFAYPNFVKTGFGFQYTASLIIIISFSTFVQYYFGCVDILLLLADQRGYIRYIVQSLTLILNTIVCSILITKGCNIHLVKIITAAIFFMRPIMIRFYVNRNYKINRKIKYSQEPIKQRNDGLVQHFAFFILTNTDIILLTLFSTLKNVSIYSVYLLVINGLYQLFYSATNGCQPLMGELWAKENFARLKEYIKKYELVLNLFVCIIYGTTVILINPFVQLYTKKIEDNYVNVSFGIIISVAYAFNVLRFPQLHMIFAAGHYKQTKMSFIIAAVINIVISVLTVFKYGLVGIAVGTLVAMIYQTIWFIVYTEKNLVRISKGFYAKVLGSDFIIVVMVRLLVEKMCDNERAGLYITSWLKESIITMLLFILISILVYLIIFRKPINVVLDYMKKKK